MSVFFTLLGNLLPLYILIGLGFIAGRRLEINVRSMARLAIYIILPVFMFGAVADMELRPEWIALPVYTYILGASISIAAYRLAHLKWRDETANLIGLSTGTANTGYFGLPLILILFAEEWLGPYMLLNFGVGLVEYTVSVYIGARSSFNARDALIKLSRFPMLYAIAAGLAWNISGLPLPDLFFDYWHFFKGAFVIIGMMIIGIGMSQGMEKPAHTSAFMLWLLVIKFIIWPMVALGILLIDRIFFGVLTPPLDMIMLIMALTPLPGNAVAYAAEFDLRPNQAATAVMVSTVIALVYIPAVYALFLADGSVF